MQLRKICRHPFLSESVEDKVNPPASSMTNLSVHLAGSSPSTESPLPQVLRHRPSLAHFLPNDQGRGHHGGLPEDDGLEVPEVGWGGEDGGESIVRAAIKPEGFGVQGLHSLDACWRPRTKPTDCRYCHYVSTRSPQVISEYVPILFLYSFDSD